MKRYLLQQAKLDLKKKMVFISGPRQVGKTTLAKQIEPNTKAYLNWDISRHRQQILDGNLPNTKSWIFDEIHKWRKWRNFLKGLYDEHHKTHQILVTGSAKLDIYRFGGDSLQGRYFSFRLHPFSVAELGIANSSGFFDLLSLGGFPEPFLSGSQKAAQRWSRDYRSHLVREEVSSMEQISDLDNMEVLLGRLPDLVGSPLSLNSLREDLQVAHATVAKWLIALENLYAIFRVAPLGSAKIKAVKKEQKHYHYDWSVVKEKGYRFENLIAAHLLKWVHFQNDTNGEDYELRYFRDIEGREVDFVLLHDNSPELGIECKYDSKDISPSLRYLKGKFPGMRALQLVAEPRTSFVTKDGVELLPAIDFLKTLI